MHVLDVYVCVCVCMNVCMYMCVCDYLEKGLPHTSKGFALASNDDRAYARVGLEALQSAVDIFHKAITQSIQSWYVYCVCVYI